VAALTL